MLPFFELLHSNNVDVRLVRLQSLEQRLSQDQKVLPSTASSSAIPQESTNKEDVLVDRKRREAMIEPPRDSRVEQIGRAHV